MTRNQLTITVSCLFVLVSWQAFGQGYLTPVVPQPYTSIPLGPNGIGVIGTGNEYVPWNAQQRQAVQRTVVNTDASGNWSVNWNTSFISSTPIVNSIPFNSAASVPMICNVTTRSATAASGKCWQVTSQAVALISLTISLAPSNAPATIPVMIVAAEPTQ